MVLRFAVGSEHAGVSYRERLGALLRERGFEVFELAESEVLKGYPAVAEQIAKIVVSGEADIGIVICGTGIGMAMAAGKVPGTRVALCTDSYMAQMAKKHNNANILAFGSRVIGFENMIHMLDTFLAEKYEGGRHDVRLKALKQLEKKYVKL